VSTALSLTGSFDTTELPRLGADPVTVTVERAIVAGREAEFEAWATEIQASLATFPGFLGAGVLRPAPSGDRRYQIVFRFTDPVSLRRWERSPERAACLERLEPLVSGTRVQRTLGVDEWFEAPEHVAPRRPVVHSILSDVAWIYPIVALVSLVVSPLLVRIPLLPRIALSTTIVTGLAAFTIAPLRRWNRRRRAF
jgi:antibiotic biosynthesis monooxygenase (ABM) superfamily enzyme